jgi:hypothetical protein
VALTEPTEPTEEIVWQPIPGSSQEFALDTRAHETLYCGTRGPGKSEIQLARFRRFVGMGYGPFWRGVIFDREYKNLDDLVIKSKKLFRRFEDGARWIGGADYKWVWPSGEELLFRAAKKEQDYWGYHGQEFSFIGWNELCSYPTPNLYNMMMSCNRSSFTEKDNADVPPIPLEVFSTTNSKGPGRLWVKEEFIDPAPYGQIIKKTSTVFNPKTQKDEEFTRTRVSIFGSYRENIYLDPSYIAGMNEACKDENTRRSWLEGSWDVSDGGAFDDLWDSELHVCPRFKIPKSWYVDRSFDWGSTHPFSVGWWALANGEEVEIDGFQWAPPAGTLFRIFEWYGCKRIGYNEGLKLGASAIAQGIIERETVLKRQGWVEGTIYPGPADNQIGQIIDVENDSTKKKMESLGVRWTESNKSSGSRAIGLELFRERLRASLHGEDPGIYFFRNCQAAIKLIPNLPLDQVKLDDIDTTSEDHIWDEVRYRVLRGSDKYSSDLKIKLN